jgi:uncharacterized protein
MKKLFFATMIVVLLLLLTNVSHAQSITSDTNPVCLNNTEQFSISSDFVKNETYLIQIGLPFGYFSSEKSFPVLYVLDGDNAFGITKGITDLLMIGKEIKEIIIVGISYGQGLSEWWNKRARDYTHCNDTIVTKGRFKNTGGADNFLEFMQNELFPEVNKNYRTIRDSSFICGSSFGGMLCTYVLFKKPEMFRGYIIAAPTLVWNNRSLLKLEIEYSGNHKELKKTVFIADGTHGDPVWTDNPTDVFISNVKNHNYNGLVFIPQYFEEETHISVFPAALTSGLKTMFKH